MDADANANAGGSTIAFRELCSGALKTDYLIGFQCVTNNKFLIRARYWLYCKTLLRQDDHAVFFAMTVYECIFFSSTFIAIEQIV